MGTIVYLFLFILLRFLTLSSAITYSVTIDTVQHDNVVDARFLSFTIDPKYLFSSSEKYSSKECICMASSLTPAYLRIAGPSTAHMTFHNTTISINDVEFHDVDYENPNFDITALDSEAPEKVPMHLRTRNLAVSHGQWKRFVYWAKATGFDLVFALNNEERTSSGMWDPNTALNILTVAEKVKVGDIFWELGYECTNQSIEEYLNDLETLRVIIETFPPGRTQEWKVVGGDVTKCLQADSKSDFKDYLTLSNDMMDALLLNGNSSFHELARMSDHDKMKLSRLLIRSETPLWLTETNQKKYNNFERAADWLTSLGLSAKNGYSVHYRELEEEEMYEPTLSFYMALLFKNLVGERVLNVQVDSKESAIFAHCTSLRHKPIPGAVTLFAENMYDEPARFLLKLPKIEDGGDIMQFILGNDHNGNIIVNGRPMYYEGNLKPAVKRVRPYKTLIINLPAKSFGFWVLANTKIEACHNKDNENKTFIEAETDSSEHNKVKRSINEDFDEYSHVADLSYDFGDTDTLTTGNNALKSRITDMNRDLNKIQNIFQKNKNRFKRDENEGHFRKYKLRKQGFRNILDRGHDIALNPRSLIDDLFEKARQKVRELKSFRSIRPTLNVNRISKRHPKSHKVRSLKPLNDDDPILETLRIRKKPKHVKKFVEKNDAFLKRVNRKSQLEKNASKGPSDIQEKTTKDIDLSKISDETSNTLEAGVRRRKRSINDEIQEISAENEIDLDGKKKDKLWKILMKLNKELGDNSIEKVDSNTDSSEGIVLKTELSDDSATIKVKDFDHGVIKATMKSMLHVLEDLNKNLNKVWSAINLLE